MFSFIMHIPARAITAQTYIPTYPEHTLDLAPDLFPLTTPPSSTSKGLGDLERLPNEIIDSIISHMDLDSLMAFRSINQQTFNAVNCVPEFKTLCDHAPQTIRGILSIGTGKWTTCKQLFDKFCRVECQNCGDFAGFFYVLGPVQRVCFFCFTHSKTYCPMSPSEAWRDYGLPDESLTSVPRMRSMPGLYAEIQIPPVDFSGAAMDARPIECVGSMTLLDQQATRHAAIRHHGIQSAMQIEYARRDSSTLGSISWPRLASRFALGYEATDDGTSDVKRWMAVIKAPYYNKQTRLTEEGFCCRACNNLAGRRGYWRRKFNAETWRDHIHEYGEIVDGKHVLLETASTPLEGTTSE